MVSPAPRTPSYDRLASLDRAAPRVDRVHTYATAVKDVRATGPGTLELRAGDRVAILDSADDVWWRGAVHGRVGVFPCGAVDHVSTNPSPSPPLGKYGPPRGGYGY